MVIRLRECSIIFFLISFCRSYSAMTHLRSVSLDFGRKSRTARLMKPIRARKKEFSTIDRAIWQHTSHLRNNRRRLSTNSFLQRWVSTVPNVGGSESGRCDDCMRIKRPSFSTILCAFLRWRNAPVVAEALKTVKKFFSLQARHSHHFKHLQAYS